MAEDKVDLFHRSLGEGENNRGQRDRFAQNPTRDDSVGTVPSLDSGSPDSSIRGQASLSFARNDEYP